MKTLALGKGSISMKDKDLWTGLPYRRGEGVPLLNQAGSITVSPSPGARNRFASSPCCRVYRS